MRHMNGQKKNNKYSIFLAQYKICDCMAEEWKLEDKKKGGRHLSLS